MNSAVSKWRLLLPRCNQYRMLSHHSPQPLQYTNHRICQKVLLPTTKAWNNTPITCHSIPSIRTFSASGCCPEGTVSQSTYEYVCSETLESLNEYFEELLETALEFKDGDVTYGDGVLSVRLGSNYGTYVINRQSPNRQIWLSSPFSGPKRYDFITIGSDPDEPNGYWLYKQDNRLLHELLQDEISKMVQSSVDFKNLPFGSRD